MTPRRDGAPSGIPPAISEALPQEIMTAIADHARAANEAGYERGLRRCVPGEASPVDYSKAEAAFKVLESAILSALPREPQQEPDSLEGWIQRVEAENARLTAAIRWALGEEGVFPAREFTAQGPYWWRSELRRRAFGDTPS